MAQDAVAQQPASDNPYDAVVSGLYGSDETRLRAAGAVAPDVSPTDAAEATQLGQRMGLPPDVVLQNLPAIRQRAQAVDTPYAQMLRDTPTTAAFASDPVQHAAAKDDLDNLGFLEWLKKYPALAWQRGQASIELSRLRAKEVLGQDLTADEHQRVEALRQQLNTGGPLAADGQWFRKAISGTAENLPFLWGSTLQGAKYGAAGALTAAPAGAAIGSIVPGPGTVAGALETAGAGAEAGFLYGEAKFGFETAAGQAYDEFSGIKDTLGRPIDPQVARVAALAVGAVNGALMTGGSRLLLQNIPGLDRLVGTAGRDAVATALRNPAVQSALLGGIKEYGKTLSLETANMVAMRAVQILGGELAKTASNAEAGTTIEHKGAGAIAQDLAHTGVDALQSFALMTLPGAIGGYYKLRAEADHAQRNTDFFTALGDGVKQSKTAQRAPDVAQAFLQNVAKDGPIPTVYAPLEDWNTYWQSKGVDPAKMAATVTGDPTVYEQATQTGGDLPIPTAAYAMKLAPTEHNAHFAEQLRLAPEQMNAVEAKQFEEHLQAQLKQPVAAGEATPVADAVRAQLEAAGYQPNVAESYATLYEQAFRALGSRANVAPADLFNRYVLRITRPDLEGVHATEAGQEPGGHLGEHPGTEPQPHEGGETPEQLAERARAERGDRAAEGVRPEVIDTATAAAQTGVPNADLTGAGGGSEATGAGEGVSPISRVAASTPPVGRESPAQQAARRTEHYTDVFRSVLDAARAVDPSVDEAALRAEFDSRAKLLEDLDQEFRDSGQNPQTLLQAIAQHGGISIESEKGGGLTGELRRIRESPELGPFGAFAGVRGVFQKRSADARGKTVTGLSLDDMVRELSQDPRFAHIESINDLVAQLEDISRLGAEKGVTFPGTRELAKGAGVALDRAWWKPENTNDALDAVDTGEGDTSFNVDEFNQSLLDELEKAPGPEESRKVPFPTVDKVLASSLYRARDDAKAARVEVPLADVVATQETISKTRAEGKTGSEAPPQAVLYNGRYYITDGTHRAAAALARGETSIAMDVAPVDPTRLESVLAEGKRPPSGVVVDTLDTGEQQPRLPGAENVRDQNIATPLFEAPFALTPPEAKGPKGRQTTLFQPLFHGSPHDFERFSLEHAGSGEGAAAYGWGLYFAENPAVAADYRERLATTDTLIDGEVVRPDDPRFEAAAHIAARGYKDALVDARRNAGASFLTEDGRRSAGELARQIETLKGADITSRKGGTVYQVDVPDEHIAKMLDWDKPLDEQPANVREALARIDPDLWAPGGSDYDAGEPGQMIYSRLAQMQGGQKEASLKLAAEGVPGLRYLDQGSRAEGNGTRNVVVFDDSIVKLTHKDGTPFTPSERKEFFQGTPQEPGARGKIRLGPGGQVDIELLKRADLSTFLHETGHFFLHVMRSLRDESPQIAGDLDTLEQTLFAGAKDDTEQHERFARGFETYLMEGKAPSAELRPVFARFRAWLTGIYRSITKLGVQLTPEVRGVFDRLVASDDAIQQAQQEGDVRPLFTTPEQAGMTPEDFGKYRQTVADASEKAREALQTRVMRDVQREQQAWWADELEKTRQQVATDYNDDKTYRAVAAIQRGTRPDGTALESEEPLKISKASLANYDADTLKSLRRFDAYRVDGGVDVNTAANLLGFSSGDELVQTLKSAQPLKQALDAEADRRMRAEHGDVLLDGTLEQKAAELVNGDYRQTVVRAELKALTKGMVAGTIPPAKTIDSIAEQRIGSTRVRDVRPGYFLAAAKRASQRAFDLMSTSEDRVGAVQAKHQELVNLALYKHATAAADFAEEARQYLGPYLNRASTRERIGKAGGDYLDQIDGLRAQYEFARVSNRELDRRASLAKWLEGQEAEGHEFDIPQEVLDRTKTVNYRDLTVDELRGVHDAVKQIEHWARFKNRLLRVQAQRDLAELAAEGSGSIGARAPNGPPPATEPRLPGSAVKRNVYGFLLAHRPLQALLRQLDGYEDGFFFRNVWTPAHEARNAETAMSVAAAQRWTEIHDARFAGEESSLYEPQYIPAAGTSLTTAARLVVALNYGNEGNRERMRAAGIGNTGPLSDAQQRAILDTLTPRDWQYVKDTADLVNSFRPQIGALYKKVLGVEPQWVEPSPFTTAQGGDMPGWYYPIAYESRAAAKELLAPDAGFASILQHSAYSRFTTENGHTKERVAHTGVPLRADLGVIGEHLENVVHDLTHREMLIDVGRLLKQADLQAAIKRSYGDQMYRELQSAFRDIAVGPSFAPDWYKPIEHLRAGVTLARLAWSVPTIVSHVTNLVNGMMRVGAADVIKAIPQWLGSAKDAENSAGWINEQSAFMASRWLHRIEGLDTARNDIGLNRGPWASTIRDGLSSMGIDPDLARHVSHSYLYGIHKVIQMAEIPTWIAAYRQAVDAGRAHADAVTSADSAVLDAFGGGDLLDQARVQRTYSGKLFTTFMTYGLSLHRLNYEIFHRDTTIGRKIVDATLLNVVPPVLLAGIFSAAQGRGYGRELADELWQHLTGMYVFLRELSGALEHQDYSGPAALAPIGQLTRIVASTAQSVESAKPETRLHAVERAGKTAAEVAGQFYGVPVYQIERTWNGLEALWSGQSHDPSALLFGPKKKAS